MRMRPASLASLVLAVVLGCGAANLASLDCRITHNGHSVSGAQVLFERGGNDPAAFFAVSLADGKCYVDLGDRHGLPAGEYRVRVTHYLQEDGTPLPPGEEGDALKAAGKAIMKQLVFQRTLASGPNALELRLEEGEEVPEGELLPPAE